mgnify:CR=1 FL=1
MTIAAQQIVDVVNGGIYPAGQALRFTAEFFDFDNNRADPDLVVLRLIAPDNNQVNYVVGTNAEAVKDTDTHDNGVFRFTPPASAIKGQWLFRIEGQGAVGAVKEGAYQLLETRFDLSNP